MKSKSVNPIFMFGFGLFLGVVSRLFDIYTEVLGNIFSEMAIWIFLGTLLSIYSISKKKAMINVFLFCIGMLFTYYGIAILFKGSYKQMFILGWTLFAFCSPLFAYFTWMTKEKGVFPKIIAFFIVTISLLSSILLFNGPRIYDLFINLLLVYFLFFKQIER